jgi:tRNA threonylcarbamoyladenosine biosynthesis protein TsaB
MLALAGCGPRLEVALRSAEGRPTSLIALGGTKPRNELIMAAVDLLLAAAGLAASDLTAVMATRGPGSFTGLRVTLATAQGLVRALAIPGAGVPSLLAQACRTSVQACLAVQPARRGLVYAQPFSRGEGPPMPTAQPSVVTVESLLESTLPIIAPVGLELAIGTATAPASVSTAEALLACLGRNGENDLSNPLTPIYVEPPAARPVGPRKR